ncbi:MAG: N-acyl-D-amino-acid deacylase family protein [Promethearchaeia archaeon]
MKILIKNGTIVDGKGSEPYKADILVEGGKIVKIQPDLTSEGGRIIDATNYVVSPGFIDMHHHGDLTILEVNQAEPAIMQGVTTLAVGMCGIGLAPANDKVRQYYSNFVTKLFGKEEMNLYDSLSHYFQKISEKGISCNLAFFIPQGNVRACLLGTEDRKPTDRELQQMKDIVKREMEEGAFGLSTGLIYPPGSITLTEELIELCKVIESYGGIYDSHMRNEGTGVISEGMEELKQISEKTNVQPHISHWKAGSNFAWKFTPDMINFVKKARKAGLNMHADMYPYEEGSTSLSGALLRPWVYEDFTKNLTDPESRQRIIEETLDMFFNTFLTDLPWYIRIIPKFITKRLVFWFAKKNVRVVSVIHNHQVEGKFLGEALDILYPGEKFEDAILNFIRDEEGAIMISFKQMSEEKSILELIQQDFVCIGSDGFFISEGNTHPRAYGCFPKILGNYVREKKLFSLEEGIRKMTGLPAEILGLKERGIIKEGYYADLVIFDPTRIEATSTYANGRQYPIGIKYVMVNGEITAQKRKHLGVLNGKILRKN